MTKSKIQNKSLPVRQAERFQMSNIKIKYAVFIICVLSFICHLCFGICHLVFAQESDKLVTLSKQIIEAKSNDELYASFEELKDLYFKEHKYSELVELLKSLNQQKETLGPFVNYYTALTRYNQLKYLEETQNWDEYFSQGNNYRDEIASAVQRAIDVTSAKDALNIYSRLLFWQFHKDQQDAFSESSLSELMSAVLEYAKEAQNANPVRAVADKLSSYGEKGKSKELHQVYINKLVSTLKADKELEDIAVGFYREGNLELSEPVYDVYIERIAKTPKENLIPVLINIARNFSYKDEGAKDSFYAEKVFKKIEEVGSKSAFDEELTYLRAWNTERMKDYPKAKDLYLDLIARYPQSKYVDEAEYKIGIILTYILKDIKGGRAYFEKLAQKAALSPQVISSLYQLGLFSQWGNDLTAAKGYYNRVVEKAGSEFPETIAMVQERLKEITDVRPIEYNLKTFLDLSLKEESPALSAGAVDLNSSRYNIKKDESAEISCTPYSVESGCMQVEIQYLWSGDVGNAKPSLEDSGFNTTYVQRGSKVINLVVVSPTGALDRRIEILNVY